MNVLLGVTGSVAAIHMDKLITKLVLAGNHNVKVVMTQAAGRFAHEPNANIDSSELWGGMGDDILHIELRNWADVLVVAPLSANTLGKIAHGLCDNLLTEVIRAWDMGKPIIICPAMNTQMWENEPTLEQINILKERGYDVIDPVVKTLACGDVGLGAMCDHDSIISRIDELRWGDPLDNYVFVPEGNHPGSFGAVRQHDVHTGVDLYCNPGDIVYAMEDGEVVWNSIFTGKEIGMPWWNTTYALLVRGKSGHINYGEINNTAWDIGDRVRKGQRLGHVVPVLNEDRVRPDIPHHSNAMLHVELYRHGYERYDWAMWNLNTPKPKELLNPTSRLKNIK